MLTERCADAYPYTRGGAGHYVIERPLEEIVGKAVALLEEDYAWASAMGLRMHSAMCGEYGFERAVRRAVRELPDSSTVEIK